MYNGVVCMGLSAEEIWAHELIEFIQYWEKELDALKEKKLDSDECSEIMDLFHRDRDLLLCRKPLGFVEDGVMMQLTPLSVRLDASLAIALCSTRL